jgi:alkylation response protein AidB-like acyl-CoA dehydrogenase
VITTEEFRTELRTWLEEHAATYSDFDPVDLDASRKFRAALWDAGFLGLTLDPEYGGRGLSDDHQRVLTEEVGRYRLPATGEAVTTGICAPTLLDYGDEDQKRHHLPRMLRGDEVWTQLLSEPGAGSDLAGLQTKAVRDGDEFVLTGQKVWTSGAMTSDYALCVARTDPDLPKHQGLSMFIVDLKATGVTIRPLRQMTGDSHFNEVFLDEVRVPTGALVGRENDGWRALTAMLTHERLALGAGTGAGGSGASWSRPASARFVELARARGLAGDPVVRQDLVKLYMAERVLGLMGQKMRDEIAAGIPVGAKGSVAKLASAILSRQSAALGMALAGPASLAWDESDGGAGEYALAMSFSPMTAIAGGTSEIQRNTIGERVLGLPKEAR